jgi:hypothetical protein
MAVYPKRKKPVNLHLQCLRNLSVLSLTNGRYLLRFKHQLQKCSFKLLNLASAELVAHARSRKYICKTYGGETASTGIKKHRLHAKLLPACKNGGK